MLIAALLDLVLPTDCAGCNTPGPVLCPNCAAQLGRAALPVVPTPAPAGFPRSHAVAPYDGVVRAALIAYKERGRRDLRRPLGGALAAAVLAALSAPAGPKAPADPTAWPVLLVPAPSRAHAVRQRGADTTKALAFEAARCLRREGLSARAVPALRLRRGTTDSAGLSAAARAANMSGAMSADLRRLPDKGAGNLVIVDDLLTTGATLAEAARALASAGRPARAAAVVAATLRQRVGFGGCAR